jgi:hypothetical protein
LGRRNLRFAGSRGGGGNCRWWLGQDGPCSGKSFQHRYLDAAKNRTPHDIIGIPRTRLSTGPQHPTRKPAAPALHYPTRQPKRSPPPSPDEMSKAANPRPRGNLATHLAALLPKTPASKKPTPISASKTPRTPTSRARTHPAPPIPHLTPYNVHHRLLM